MDRLLKALQRASLIFFMLTIFLILKDEVIKWFFFAIFSLYAFLAITYINHLRKNDANEDVQTKQVAIITLAAVYLMVMEYALFKLYMLLS